jgi:hypothetical protein
MTNTTADELFSHVPLARHDFTEALNQAKCEGYVDEPWDKTWNILTEKGAAWRNRMGQGL